MGIVNTRLKCKTDLSENWESISNTFIPLLGEICIYSDKNQENDEFGKTIYYPDIKVGDGESYLY